MPMNNLKQGIQQMVAEATKEETPKQPTAPRQFSLKELSDTGYKGILYPTGKTRKGYSVQPFNDMGFSIDEVGDELAGETKTDYGEDIETPSGKYIVGMEDINEDDEPEYESIDAFRKSFEQKRQPKLWFNN